ncbi:hypothetical protein D9M68_950940 [compost metagenome]
MACTTMALPACCRICWRARLAVSTAKSVSTMRERLADRFSLPICRLAMADSSREDWAPMTARWLFT